MLNGYGLGETHFGGYAEKARVKGDWLIKLPAGLTRAEAMAIGTAGYTAMLCVLALERQGMTPPMGPVVVTGAAGGVGSVAIALLAKAGWSVVASTGRAERGRLSQGARRRRDRRARDALGARQAARQGALGGGGRQRRLDDARQRPGADALWRRGRRLRPRRRHGPARDRRAVHLARRAADRRRQRPMPDAAAAGGLGEIGARPRSRRAGAHDETVPFARTFEIGASVLAGRVRGRIVVAIA